nr:ASPIC/UnbV domain-containing protein [Chitinophagaceae bacterium]
DFNNDGFWDVTARNQLWINGANANHFIKLKLKGVESNVNAIGARVEIYGKWGKQIREVRSGQSYSPMHSLNILFGIGKEKYADSLIVRWPSGIITKIQDIAADQFYTIVETACNLPKYSFDIENNINLCPREKITLSAPKSYTNYWWSNSVTDDSITISDNGHFSVIFQDENGCRGISDQISVFKVIEKEPQITVVNDIYPNCRGSIVQLFTDVGKNAQWSNGETGSAIISIDSSGYFYVMLDSVCGDGKIKSNDFFVEFFEATLPSIEKIEKLDEHSYEVNLSGENCLWYDRFGNLLYDGCSRVINNIIGDTIFFVQGQKVFRGEIFEAGKKDTSGFKTNFPFQRKMYFTADKPFVLESVDMYISDDKAIGPRNITLFDSNNKEIETINTFLEIGKNEVKLNFNINMGSYHLTVDRTDQLLNIDFIDYPFPLGRFGRIDSSSVSLNFYPYFYNWKIRQQDVECNSALTPISINTTLTEDDIHSSEIIIYPNPNDGIFQITGLSSKSSFRIVIYDILKNIQTELLNYNKGYINCEDYPSGIYVINVYSEDSFLSKKIIITH